MSTYKMPSISDLFTSLGADARLYAVLNSLSDSDPRSVLATDPNVQMKPLWQNTPYENWEEAMPWLAELNIDSPFLDWAEQTSSEDWGLILLATSDMEAVLAHMRSLTKVYLPSGKAVLFRFYDPRFSLSIASQMDDTDRALLLGPSAHWLHKSTLVSHPAKPAPVAITQPGTDDYPWFTMSGKAMEPLKADTQVLEINLFRSLEHERPDLFYYWPEACLQLKIRRFVRCYKGPSNQYLRGLVHELSQQQNRVSPL